MQSWKQTLTELVRDQFAPLKRQAFLLCGNDSEAEDLVQEAVVRAFARPLRPARYGAAEAYVRVIMVNLFIDGTRRRSRWIRVAPLLSDRNLSADPADQLLSRNVMLAALRRLSPRQRVCVVLRYYEDLPVAQIASALGVGEGTVKRCLSEALSRLAAHLSPSESG
jgi:RNA polymerase sigma-70 factor (sigma-E family)